MLGLPRLNDLENVPSLEMFMTMMKASRQFRRKKNLLSTSYIKLFSDLNALGITITHSSAKLAYSLSYIQDENIHYFSISSQNIDNLYFGSENIE